VCVCVCVYIYQENVCQVVCCLIFSFPTAIANKRFIDSFIDHCVLHVRNRSIERMTGRDEIGSNNEAGYTLTSRS